MSDFGCWRHFRRLRSLKHEALTAQVVDDVRGVDFSSYHEIPADDRIFPSPLSESRRVHKP